MQDVQETEGGHHKVSIIKSKAILHTMTKKILTKVKNNSFFFILKTFKYVTMSPPKIQYLEALRREGVGVLPRCFSQSPSDWLKVLFKFSESVIKSN